MALIFLFYIFFSFLSLYCMLTLKICARVFSGSIVVRTLKHGIPMDNELLYCVVENRTRCFYSCLYLSIFLSFKARFVPRFSVELFKIKSSIVECIKSLIAPATSLPVEVGPQTSCAMTFDLAERNVHHRQASWGFVQRLPERPASERCNPSSSGSPRSPQELSEDLGMKPQGFPSQK